MQEGQIYGKVSCRLFFYIVGGASDVGLSWLCLFTTVYGCKARASCVFVLFGAMLYLVGLGLCDATDITVKGLEIVRRASRLICIGRHPEASSKHSFLHLMMQSRREMVTECIAFGNTCCLFFERMAVLNMPWRH